MLAKRSIGPRSNELLEQVLHALADVADPARSVLTPPQQEALSALEAHAVVPGGGIGLLAGSHGSGKSLLVARLAPSFEQAGAAVAVVETGLLEFEDLLLELTSQLTGERSRVPASARLYERLALFKAALVDQVIRYGRRLIAFFDDADSMSPECLERLATLTHLRSAGAEHVMPVLVGTDLLRRNLSSAASTASRVGTVAEIRALEPGEASAYLAQRLAATGLEAASAFEPQAIDRLHEMGLRSPRRIDSVCRTAARRAFAADRRVSQEDLAVAAAALPDTLVERSRAFGR